MALARCCLRRALVNFSSVIYQTNRCTGVENTPFLSRESQTVYKPRQYSDTFVHKLVDLPDYETFKNPPEWKYVERLLPLKTVPKPIPKDEYPSGWIPPSPKSLELPYYVKRTKNHYVPVYLLISHRGQKKATRLRYIHGDIHLLAEEIKEYLIKKNNCIITLRVNELCRMILVKGDYYYDVKTFLENKGF